MNKEILVTGIRSTGELHLGNYFGAMKGLIDLQERYNPYYFIADIHSLTTHPNPENMKKNVFEVTELHTYLSMVMPIGDLMRCPTFKEKVKKHPDNVNYGLVGYPVLMAADILIHHGEVVPVGEDQLVHLEITRTIVRRFNNLYGEIFKEPQPISENAVRIPSLSGQGKMSKSDNADSYLGLGEDSEEIQRKIRKAYSDPTRVYKHQAGNPTKEGCNVYNLHSFFTNEKALLNIESQCIEANIGCVQCKGIIAESIASIIEPFKERRKKLTDEYIYKVLLDGRNKAKVSAQKVISEVRKAIGLQMF